MPCEVVRLFVPLLPHVLATLSPLPLMSRRKHHSVFLFPFFHFSFPHKYTHVYVKVYLHCTMRPYGSQDGGGILPTPPRHEMMMRGGRGSFPMGGGLSFRGQPFRGQPFRGRSFRGRNRGGRDRGGRDRGGSECSQPHPSALLSFNNRLHVCIY